ncbi:cell wall-active antibiotics response protein LiaF [Bacillus shivajii]|uniref:cell wall-active antibiotics response protein LiaF n=1 Tax=Bacillus shivajii TaxID=1983719 RepID=UPI001CFB0168|nr:cell wall-active antibiotics response protein LiaF [Bacillus shivajii]UCZ52115.1 cell wall-active antibiotics response protein LiaF [Bacillus shivajii]
MLKHMSTNAFNWIFLVGAFLFVFEVLFLGRGIAFAALLFILFIYFGKKYGGHLVGKLFFWFGVTSLIFTFLSLIAVRFLFIMFVIIFFIQYHKSKEEPERVKPQFDKTKETAEGLVYVESLFKNRFFGKQKTSQKPYQWRDINVHGGIGDRIIDLSNTVLREDGVISIRHGIGDIKVYIPYEVEVKIDHSAVFGRATIFQERHESLFNKKLSYVTAGYNDGTPRVKIVTSILSGDIEVKRI